MRVWGVVVVGAVVLAACSGKVRNERGGDATSSAGNSAGGDVPVVVDPVPTGGTNGVSGAGGAITTGVAGALIAGAGDANGGFAGQPFHCEDGDYSFGSNGEGEAGASYGSTTLLGELVGTWKLADEDALGYVYEWTIDADGTGTYREQVAAHGSQAARTTVSTGRVHVNEVVLVLDRITTTVTDESGTESHASSEHFALAYSYDADAHPNTLYLGPPDCGVLSYDPFERR